MLFTPENAQKVMAGEKRETRRIVKDNEFLGLDKDEQAIQTVYRTKDGRAHVKWQVGRTYAVCPGRGKHAVGRIKIVRLSQENLQSIWGDDLIAEGLGDIPEFVREIHFSWLWDSINKTPGTRWDDNPDVFVIEFEVIE